MKQDSPVFPLSIPGFTYGDGNYETPSIQEGITARQYFAALALQGLLAKHGFGETADDITTHAVLCADKLIDALNKTP